MAETRKTHGDGEHIYVEYSWKKITCFFGASIITLVISSHSVTESQCLHLGIYTYRSRVSRSLKEIIWTRKDEYFLLSEL